MKKILLAFLFTAGFAIAFAQDAERMQALEMVYKNQQAIGLTDADIRNSVISDTYFNKTSGTRLVYLQQAYLDIPVYNQILTLSFKEGRLVYKSGQRINSIEKKVNVTSGVPAVMAEQAVHAALRDRKLFPTQPAEAQHTDPGGRFIRFNNMGISREPITANLMWVPTENHQLKLSWLIYVIPTTSSDYWMVRVDASNQQILGMDNYTVYCNWDAPHKDCHKAHQPVVGKQPFNHTSATAAATGNGNSPSIVNDASYLVVPFPVESPNHFGGNPAVVSNPWNAAPGNATSLKWHSDGTTDYNITRGNNVWAKEDRNGTNSTTGSPATSTTATSPLQFQFTPNFSAAPTQITPAPNQAFNITNLFYWNNIIHDITYQYGFDEPAGNFQANNQGRGGNGNDFVFADAQDGSGTNNANFSTPSDGGNGRMQMFLWSGSPQKDGDVDNGVITHEFGHGISNRLTGGPSQAGCLQNAEQAGEGWSDYYGLMYTQNWANSSLTDGFNSPRGIGTYVIGQNSNGLGIRSQKYCTNFAVNNKVYANSISAQQHNRGEIWCATLWDMTWNIINQVGTINPNIYDAAGGGGNTIALKLVTEGMKLQPCSPGFIDGRDAILAADSILYNGAYSCAIREAFRRRGMGAFATQGSSSSVTDQVADFTAGSVRMKLTQGGITEVPEGQTITYTNTVTNGPCAAIANFLITDTLPTNVTYVSGGTYNSANRVVSFPVNLNAGQSQEYSFTVLVNAGAYFPTVTLFSDLANTGTIPAATWSATTTSAANWVSSTARSFSPPNSFYAQNLDVQSDQRLIMVNPVALGATPPPLSFRHWFNSEGTYDGGVLEVSTDGGTIWTDVRPNITLGGYTGTMDNTTLLAGRQAWTGSSNGAFMRTVVNLTPYANQSVKFRFRFTSDVGTNLEGWYVDDIYIRSRPTVDMFSYLFNASNVKVIVSDTTTLILPPNGCANATVTTQPANTVVCTGSDATFSVTATGTTPAYQWQVSTDGGNTWTDISGATNSSLTVTGVTAAMSNNRYRVKISNTCPSNATSDAAILTVNEPASISAQPTDATICAGGNTSFSVTAAGTNVGYQWQVSTDGGTTWTDVSGATSATLSLTNVAASFNNNRYRVLLSSCSATALNSAAALLTVNTAAIINTQPASVIGCSGSNVQLTVAASGTNVTYQWQVSTDGGITFTDIPGETSATLNLTGVTTGMNQNQYHVLINSSTCPQSVTSQNATLTVSNAALINTNPFDASACPGSNVQFNVTASGTNLSYQWQISTDGGSTWTDISGATTNSYSANAITAAMNNNRYRVLVSNSCSSAATTSAAAILTVQEQASISLQPANNSVCLNGDASFSVTATGTGLTYQWQISTDGGNTFANITGANAASYNLTAVTSAQNDTRYRVVVAGQTCGNVNSSAAILTVNPLPTVTLNASPYTNIYNGLTTTITASATPAGAQWNWTYGGNPLSSATGSSITVNHDGLGDYAVTVTDVNGCVNSSNAISIGDSLFLTAFIFPNPNNGTFFVRDVAENLISNKRMIMLFDAKGARVYSKLAISSGANLPIAVTVKDLANGIYVLVLADELGNSIRSAKVIIQH